MLLYNDWLIKGPVETQLQPWDFLSCHTQLPKLGAEETVWVLQQALLASVSFDSSAPILQLGRSPLA